MRKFLSILLAVMMVLSTVSFAAPSAIGSVQTADEYVAVETVPAEEAELEAELTAADASQYGTLLFEDTFDNATTDTPAQYQGAAALGGVVNDAYAQGVKMQYTFDGSRAIVTDGDNKYYSSTGRSAGYTTNSVYNVGVCNYHQIAPTGVYTFTYDLLLSDGAAASQVFTRFQQSNNAGGYNGAYQQVQATPPATGAWTTMVHTLDATAWTNGLGSVEFYTLLSAGGTINYDNIRIYYKEATADVTLNYDGAAYTAANVSTAGVKVADIISAANISFGIMKATGITDGTTTYGLNDTVVLGGDAEFTVTAEADPMKDIEAGTVLWAADFDNLDAKSLGTYSDWVDVLGGVENTIDSGNIQLSNSAGTASISADKTLSVAHTSAGYKQMNVYGIATANYHQIAPAGIYEFSVDVKLSNGATASTSFVRWCESDNAGGRYAGSNFHQVGKSVAANTWQTITWTINTNTDVTPWTNGLGTLELYVQLATAGTIEYDNFKLTYKPFTVDVTLDVDGEKTVVENVSTAGVDVATIISDAGIVAPYGKKAVASLTQGGETKANYKLAFDTTLYVSFVDDNTFHKEYGQALAILDFEDYTAGDTFAFGTVNGTIALQGSMGDKAIKADNGGLVLSTGATKFAWAQVRYQMSDYATRPDGYYTMVADAWTDAAGTSPLNAKVQGGAYSDKAPVAYTVGDSAATTNGSGSIAGNTWAQAVAVYDGAYNDYTIYFNTTSGLAAFDNIALYYKPKTVTVKLTTEEAGVADATVNNVDTKGVVVSSLVSGLDASKTNKDIAGVKFEGKTYALNETLILCANAEVEVLFGTTDLADPVKGSVIAAVDFDDAAVGATSQYSDFVDVYKGIENTPTGGNLQFVTSASREVTADGTFKFAGAATYNQLNLYGLANANYYQIAPAGVYELVMDVKLSGGAALAGDGLFVRWCESNNVGSANQANNYHQTGYKTLEEGWNTVSFKIDTQRDVTPWTNGLGILQIFTQLGTAGSVELDNFKLYYKPATVEVKIVDEDDNVLGTADVATSGITAKELADLVATDNPFESVTAVTYGGVEYSGSDVLYFTRNATLVAVIGKNAYLDQAKGELVVDMNFDNTDALASGAFQSSAAANFGYANPKYPKAAGVVLQLPKATGTTLEEDADGNKYLATVLDAQYNNYNYYSHDGSKYDPVWAGDGIYTIEMDVRVDGTYADPEKPVQAGLLYYGGGAGSSNKYFAIQEGDEWMHVEYTKLYTAEIAAGNSAFYYNMLVNNSADYNNVVGHFDNMRVWFKPATATITAKFDGEVVKTVAGVSTTETTVGAILEAVQVRGYTITGFNYAGVDYTAEDAETVVAFPGDATITLAGEKLPFDPNAPMTSDESSIRVADDAIGAGIRFKASLSNEIAENAVGYGWYIFRKVALEAAGFNAADFDVNEALGSVTYVEGWNYMVGDVDEPVIYDMDDENTWFTAVLYNIPEGMYDDVLVAVPVSALMDEEDNMVPYYGAPVAKSIRQVATDVQGTAAYDALDDDQKAMVDAIVG